MWIDQPGPDQWVTPFMDGFVGCEAISFIPALRISRNGPSFCHMRDLYTGIISLHRSSLTIAQFAYRKNFTPGAGAGTTASEVSPVSVQSMRLVLL